MHILNVRYEVLSRGLDEPEEFPQSGDSVNLAVRVSVPRSPWDGDHSLDRVFDQIGFPHPHSIDEPRSVETATTVANNVSMLGPYARVKGIVRVGEREGLVGTATYDLRGKYSEGTLIGDLVLKIVLERLDWEDDLGMYVCPDYP